MSKRFIYTILTIIVIGLAAALAIFLAKGYRFSTKNGTITGTGIMSITSIPDQASVFLDGHLTTATNANVNSLIPKSYDVKILKEGFIPWEKKVEVKEGLVSEVKATLFRAIPSVYPLTYTGAENAMLSPDGQKLLYVVPPASTEASLASQRKSGVWVWQMSQSQISFARGGEPHQIASSYGSYDYSKAQFRFSPDSSQILVSLPDRSLLLDSNKMNDPARDITPTLQVTLKNWQDDQKANDATRMQLITDLALKKTASASATLKWAPDETKFLYSQDGKENFKVVDIQTRKTFDIPKADSYSWLPDSEHLVLVESQAQPDQATSNNIQTGKILIVEYDGMNKSEIFAGLFDPNAVVAWPDSSRLVIISTLPIATASQPNLYGVNLK